MFDIMRTCLDSVGVVGVGTMAKPMVHRLVETGLRDVHLYDANPNATADLIGLKGVSAHNDLEQLVESCAVVLLSLPGPAAVEDTVKRVLRSPPSQDLTLVNTSTSGIATSRKCVDLLASTEVQFVDAPVSGGVTAARQGTLTFILSGPEDGVSNAEPLLQQLGSNLFNVGTRPGLAQAVKSANNMLGLGALLATAEATAVLAQLGVDTRQAIDVFNASSGRNSATLEKFPREVLTGRFSFGFSFASVVKDLDLFIQAAEEAGIEAGVAGTVHAEWQQAADQGWADLDCTRVVDYVLQLSANGISRR